MTFVLALLLSSAPAATVKLQESGEAKVGSAAPSFGGWDLTGRKVLTLDGLRRTPTMALLLITFGASWCKPCNEGLPRLRAVAARHPELRLVLIDVEPDQEMAQQFAARTGVDGPVLLDKFEQTAKTYGVAGAHQDGNESMALPRTFLVDTMGKVRAIYSKEGADLEAVIEADLEAAKSALRPASAQSK